MKYFTQIRVATFLILTACPSWALAQAEEGPSALIVVAHPDDEAMFGGAVYKITHELEGRVDLALITDGAGGYRFSTLAEPIYGLRLTDPKVAAEHMPAIRKKELLAAGEIIGISNYYFLDQPDRGRSDNPEEFFSGVWDTTFVKERLGEIMRAGDYDFVFVHLPVVTMHAHHKVATMLALEVARSMSNDVRPVVLGGWYRSHNDTTGFHFDQLEGYDITRVDPHPYEFDRSQPIGLDGRLNYNIVVNWEIAEHKSQGTMQLLMHGEGIELYYYFLANDGLGRDKAKSLFERLAVPRPAPTASH